MTVPASSLPEDPWDWNTDQVVTALCDPTATFRATNNARALPDAVLLEQKLREHFIEGPGLLSDLEYATLRDDLGIKAVGHQGHIVREIRRLRRISQQFVDQLRQDDTSNSRAGRASVFGPTRYTTPLLQPAHTPSRQPITPDTPAQSTLVAAEIIKSPTPAPRAATVDGEGKARFQTSIQHSQEWLDQLPDNPEAIGSGSPVKSVENQLPDRPEETYVIDDNGRKRRRLVLNPVASTALDDNQGQNPVDTHSTAPQEPEQPPEVISPRQIPASNDAIQRRITPTLLPRPSDNTSLITAPAKRKLELLLGRKPIENYLGIRALPVDDVFYDQEDQDQDQRAWTAADFVFVKPPASTGQRRYVSARIKYFLRQRASVFQRGNKACNGVCPYPDSLGRKHQPLSITIYDSTPNGILATRRDRSQWRLTSSVLPPLKHDRQGPAIDNDDKLVTLPSDNGQDWDYLNKWDDAHGNNAVLPVYGESGSEGDYDSDTWREMEKENGVLPKPLGRPRRLQMIDVRESTATIDQAVQQMVADWKQKRLPNLERTAWAIWSRSRRNGSMKATVLSLQYELQHLETRLTKLRKEIAGQHWLSAARVRRQCECMRRTVYGVEDSRWTIGVLELEHRPLKPRRLHKGKKNPSLFSEETNKAEPDEYETSPEEDLGSFIVDDDQVSNHSDNGGLISTGNEDAVMSQSSTSNDGIDGTDDDRSDPNSCRSRQQVSVSGSKANVPTTMPMKQEKVIRAVTPKPSPANFVDLTLSDTSESEVAPELKTSKANNIRTPFAYSADIDENEDPSQRSQRKAAEFRIPPGTDINQNIAIDLEQDDTSKSDTERTMTPEPLELDDIQEISEMDPTILMEQGDRRRLLIYILARKDLQQRKDANTYVINHGIAKVQKGVWDVFPMLRRAPSKVVGGRRKQHFNETVKNITAWYICWTNLEIIKPHDGATQRQIELAEADKEGFETFYAFLEELRCLSDFEPDPGTTSDKAKTTPSKQPRVLMDYSDDEAAATPTKKRKYAVPESQEAADTRQKAHQRVADREKRQSRLKKTLQRMGKTEEDPSQVVVNMGKLDHQDLICLLPSIGERIQPHQKDGLRFLWREIIEDHASKQGCLLAQTMGLGKTMQVISFLITVADAARSSNANIREQIPPRLMRSQTIVLCPPTLVENWYDEFLIWAPHGLVDNIGDVRTVSSTMPPSDRLQTIRDWDKDGGILVLPFSMLRSMIENPIRNGEAQLSESQHLMVKRVLLERPNIVVADEAHTFKNPSAQIARIMSQFRSRSRIALTGSPLSNNLSEYYALIQWIAPGYLGEPTEFRFRYEEPITQGLYRDSSLGDWRRGLKKLEVFKREVAPKIHRADLSVLQTSLKGKSEFVIKVAPTKLQEQLYQAFISSMTEQLKGSEVQMKLLGWIDILRLICNHPQCYYNKLKSPPTKGRIPAQTAPGEEVEANDDPDLSNMSPLDLAISETIIRHQLEPFKNLPVPIAHVSLANKMKVLMQILDLSINAGDKVLVFTHSIPTLDYIEKLLQKEGKEYVRMDGSVRPDLRQSLTKNFNQYRGKNVFIISTRAGGTGLNLVGANRVVIMDDGFNPTWEEQAVGRAYRIGQTKPVFVYRLTVGGTFEDVLHNQSLFKQQLATRAVDKKNIARSATRELKDYFQPLKTVEQTDLKPCQGKDPEVLDYILASQNAEPIIRDIVPCETFKQEIDEKLTEEEQKEVELEEADSRLRRADPAAYQARLMAQSAPKNTQSMEAPGTQATLRTSGAALPMPPNPPSGPAHDINMATTAGMASPPIVDPIPPMPSSATRGLSNTAKLFGDLVPRGNGISTVDPRQVSGGPRSQAPTNAVPPNQSPVGLQHPMLPILGASTTLRTAASVPPKPHHVDLNAAQRAESEPWPMFQPAKANASPSKGAWAKYPELQGLLDREAKRTKRS
ncbi:MAG: hypothetical protein L6R38_008187 [Xanthoria sp. 2 TBL-2021]|nr:MAG: hypothetical protein L6R38_008187 [Xanthoria sp. 2 TBL-2021]